MRFSPSMNAAVSARLADAGRLRSARRSPRASVIFSTRRDRPVTSATASCPKCCTIWSSADGTGGNDASFSMSASRRADGLLAEHGVAVLVEDGPRHEVAVVVGERLLELHREGVGQELDDGLAGREVDVDVVPFGRGDLGDAALHQRLAGGDELDDGGAAGVEVGLDRADEARALHRRQQVPEEALLRALEGAHGGGLGVLVEGGVALGDAGRLQRLPGCSGG